MSLLRLRRDFQTVGEGSISIQSRDSIMPPENCIWLTETSDSGNKLDKIR
jgi:hypothetical protein